MHSELSVALNKPDNKTENNTISSRLLVLLLSFLAAAAAAIVPGVSSVRLCRCGGWWQALVKELAWQTAATSNRKCTLCAMQKSHRPDKHKYYTTKHSNEDFTVLMFFFFFLMVLLFNVVLPLCRSYIFSSSIVNVWSVTPGKTPRDCGSIV